MGDKMVPNISIESFSLLRNVNIVDIRSIECFNTSHIPGSKNIELHKLLIAPEKNLNKHELYYLYCQKGTKSLKLCKMLISKGYKVININEGYEGWMLKKQ